MITIEDIVDNDVYKKLESEFGVNTDDVINTIFRGIPRLTLGKLWMAFKSENFEFTPEELSILLGSSNFPIIMEEFELQLYTAAFQEGLHNVRTNHR